MKEDWGNISCINSIAHKSTFHHTPYLTAHLEFVNPAVLGKARIKQFYCGDTEEDMCNVIPILLHGNAAFARDVETSSRSVPFGHVVM
jgi:hypothetical protein